MIKRYAMSSGFPPAADPLFKPVGRGSPVTGLHHAGRPVLPLPRCRRGTQGGSVCNAYVAGNDIADMAAASPGNTGSPMLVPPKSYPPGCRGPVHYRRLLA